MKTWADIRAFVRARFAVDADHAESLHLSWDFGNANVSVPQTLVVEKCRAFDEEWVLVTADVCARADLDPAAALVHNARYAIGHLALEGDTVTLRQSLRLATLVLDDFARSIDYVSFEAATLRRSLRCGTPGPAPVYVD